MKVVIQHPVSHHFFSLTDQWRSCIEDAQLFDSASAAVSYGSENIKRPYNIVLQFEDPPYESSILAAEIPAFSEGLTTDEMSSSLDPAQWIIDLKERSDSMILSSQLLIGETHKLVVVSRQVIADTKKSVAESKICVKAARRGHIRPR